MLNSLRGDCRSIPDWHTGFWGGKLAPQIFCAHSFAIDVEVEEASGKKQLSACMLEGCLNQASLTVLQRRTRQCGTPQGLARHWAFLGPSRYYSVHAPANDGVKSCLGHNKRSLKRKMNLLTHDAFSRGCLFQEDIGCARNFSWLESGSSLTFCTAGDAFSWS